MNRNDSLDLHRMPQHPKQLEHAPTQDGPVVWKWVPDEKDGAGEQFTSSALPMDSTSHPTRVLYSTAERIETDNQKEIRPLLIQNKVDALVAAATISSTSAHYVPDALKMIPRHGLAPQSFLSNLQCILIPTDSQHATESDGSLAVIDGAGGELEVANLLLNMGGNSSKAEKSIKNKKETSSGNISSFKNSPPSESNNQPTKSVSSTAKTPVLEDIYLKNWVGSSVSLHTPEDDDVLSPLHCFMRRYCVEAFSATAEDVATPRYGKSHGFKVEIGQVGIRCLHCKDCSPSKRAERAVCYPSSLRNIYHSIETWQRRHSLVCKKITPWVRKSIMDLMESSKTRAGGRRQYWEDSARRLGMVDTSRGVRFARKPGDLGPIAPPGSSPSLGIPGLPEHKPQQVVRADDKDLVTDYLFLLMEQMQTCSFTEEDRTGGRSKIKDNEVGFQGMECRHCQGRAGFGRYFPSSVAALSLANSDRNVYNHLQKCRRCPEAIKDELVRLQKYQAQSKNRRGLRKLFFNRIWTRMHADDKKAETKKEANNPSPSAVETTGQNIPPMFVPYTSPQQPPQLPPSIMAHAYNRSTHPQVAVNNFRGY